MCSGAHHNMVIIVCLIGTGTNENSKMVQFCD